MAKFTCMIPGMYDFDETVQYFHDHLCASSITASFENGCEYRAGDLRVVTRVYERYTLMGDNRLSMTVTLASDGGDIFACAITAAGDPGLVKIWGWGEDSYLEHFIEAAKQFEGMTPTR